MRFISYYRNFKTLYSKIEDKSIIRITDTSLQFKYKSKVIYIKQPYADRNTLLSQWFEIFILRVYNIPVGIVLDRGAHIRFFTLFSLLQRKVKYIIAVEPVPKFVQSLKINIFENHLLLEKVKIVQKALHSRKTITFFIVNKESSRIASNEVHKKNLLTVNTTTLSNLLKKYKPNFIKLDIEGGIFCNK